MKPEPEPPKGFSYTVTDEALQRYAEFTTEEKLRWLAEVTEFIDRVAPPGIKELHEKFRRAQI
jgi:hypothetical protein